MLAGISHIWMASHILAKCIDITFSFTKNNIVEIPTASWSRSTQFPLVVESSISAALVLSLDRRRASSLMTRTGSRS